MGKANPQPTPVFTPWDGQAMTLRHHEDRERVGRITATGTSEWLLSWHMNYQPPSHHPDAQHAVAAACEQYPAYLAAEYESAREVHEQAEYQERFMRRQAGAVARALRIPTGGQRGWQDRRTPPANP